jgi:hypothetical protein
MIREIPLNPAKPKSTPNLLSPKEDAKQSDSHSERVEIRGHKDDDPELNPVEWIMITRSDPGGGIPRFMVERNRPASIASDSVNFLDWATSLDEIPEPDEDVDKQESVQQKAKERQHSHDFNAADTNGHLAGIMPLRTNQSVTTTFEPSRPGDTGIIASLTSAVGRYAPNMVNERLGLSANDEMEQFPPYSESESDDSFDSFPELTADWKTAYENPRTPDPLDDTESSLSLAPSDHFENSSDHKQYERELKKLAQRRKTLDERMEKARETERKKKEELESKEEREQQKQRERLEREKKKQEERYKKEMEKLPQKKEREEKKIEAKRKKARDKDTAARDRREKDEYRRRVEILQRENELLRRQLGDLQRENTLLVQKVGKLGEGQSVVKQVREEMERRIPRSSSEFFADRERKRTSSLQSRETGESKKSGEAGKSKLAGMENASDELVGGRT